MMIRFLPVLEKIPKCVQDRYLHRFTNREEGDIIRVVTPGAGGYGDPKKRPVENVLKDVVEQKVSVEAAKSEYGVVVVPDGVSFRVDYEGTTALR